MPDFPNGVCAAVHVAVDRLLAVAAQEDNLVWNFEEDCRSLVSSLVVIRLSLEDAERRHPTDDSVRKWLNKVADAAYDADAVVDEISYEMWRRTVEGDNQTKKSKTGFICFDATTDEEFQRKMTPKFNRTVGQLKSIADAALITHRFEETDPILFPSLPPAPVMGTGRIAHIDPYFSELLTEEECWSLLNASLLKAMPFGSRVSHQCEMVVKDIAGRYRGLPSAVKLIGRSLEAIRGINEKQRWLSIIQKKFASYDQLEDDGSILQVMKICYDLLPSPSLKICFSYCSVFARDSMLDREQLVQLWMAQGFLSDRDPDMEATGNVHFDILLHRCFLKEAVVDKLGNIVSCKMPDLVHDLALLLSKSETYNEMCDFTEGYEIPNARHLVVESLQGREGITKEKAINVRSLFSKASITDDILPYFNRLHSLILREAYIKELPSSVEKLIHLRYLDASYNPIERLPDSVSKLYHLETLRIFTLNLQELPEKLHNLIRLRHLFFNSPQTEMPPHIGRLTCLQTLSSFNVSDKEGCRIDELGHLKKLGGKLTIRNLELVNDKEEATKADMIRKEKLCKLKFIWSKSREGDNNDQNVLEGLQPHKNLKIMKIEGFRGKNFPPWTMKMEIDGLIQIKMSHCDSCENIPMLGHLPHLKYLEFDGLTSVTSVDTSFYYGDDTSSSQEGRLFFPSLERLVVKKMANLVNWKEPARVTGMLVFPRLDYLEVSECPKLTDLQISMGHLPLLRHLELYSLTNVRSIYTSFCGDNSGSQEERVFFPALERAVLKKMPNLVAWEQPACGFQSFPRLEYLELNLCPRLMDAPTHFPCLTDLCLRSVKNDPLIGKICNNDLTSLTKLQILFADEITCLPNTLFCNNQNLRELQIYHCPKLRELPEGLHSLDALQTLEICDCPSLQSISYSGEHKGLTTLRHLNISYCQRLSCLPSEMLKSCTRLSFLSIFKCPELTSLPERIDCFSGLTELSIGQFSERVDFSSFQATLEGIQQLQSLRGLTLYGREDWDTLPHELQHLTSITELGLHDFGIQAFPEWLQNLSSLQQLKLWRCENLEEMPSKESMLCLKELKSLHIEKCLLLRKKCTGPANCDELSHIIDIPDVKIDGRPIVFWLNR